MNQASPLLAARNLRVSFAGGRGTTLVLDGVDLELGRGEVLALIGESGCGKTTAALALIGLLAPTARVSGSMILDGQTLSLDDEAALGKLRGRRIGMIFQEPISSLNPVLTIGEQVDEVLQAHKGMDRRAARVATVELLRAVGLPEPELRAESYPHQLSGGQRQRAAIAAAIAAAPSVLLADEPTSALDVTVQAQIVDLLRGLTARDMALLFVTHDMALAAELADRIAVMYLGRMVEVGPAAQVLAHPAHPYTEALVALSLPFDASESGSIAEIPGRLPSPGERPAGCAFAPRCPRAEDVCRQSAPALEKRGDRLVACYRPGPAPSP
jgi:oligopeptide/dipeptide ABC transporter ATP-binding protein